jgi:hypothetical protein
MTPSSFAKRCGGRPVAPSWWEGPCPLHPDDGDLLTIHRGFDNRILLRCKARCERNKIIEAVGLSEEDFFGPLPEIIEPMEGVVRRPRPVKGVPTKSPAKDGKHEDQTNQAWG